MLKRGLPEAFIECLPLYRPSPNWVSYHHEVARISLGEVSRGFIIGGPTNEQQHLFTKSSSEAGLG